MYISKSNSVGTGRLEMGARSTIAKCYLKKLPKPGDFIGSKKFLILPFIHRNLR